MQIRSLSQEDAPALEGLLAREPTHNLFHLSALAEHGLAPAHAPQGRPWAIGAFRNGDLAGVLMALRGTGSTFHQPGDAETLETLSEAVFDRAQSGALSLLSGHATQVGPLLPLVLEASIVQPDRCHFRTLYKGDLVMPDEVLGFGRPRRAGNADMERLIDFYEIGFYSLAHLPTRQAWRNRLSEQLAFRTLFIIEDAQGRVISAALSSAEGGGGAMIGGVATLDAYRGKGLSSLCVAALCDHLFNKGLDSISLFYLLDNTPAGRVYDKLGFRDAGEWLLAPLGLGASFGPLLALQPR
jgi:RimJ/RimL family protein N-acetyltransferase